ncbi:hypothetical protein [Nitrosomonas sp.]|uniref:hypothetical protein n=1 Tax=Nitrosomonas sp. TaxID=42353 RepID=UPI0025F966BC|nr:hypothetical protein [Nitrosomonas sp.]
MLDITGDHISKLNDEDLRTLVVRLCEAELRRLNIPLSAVTAGGHQNAADGGIDVRVELPDGSPDLDFILKSVTGFQVKQEDMPPNAIRPEMRPNKKLRLSICELASKKGAYVIVSGKGSTADSALNNRKSAMQDAISDLPPGTSLTLDFYDRDRLARWIRSYRGVALWLLERIGEPLAGWLPYGKWAYGDSVDSEYLLDDKCRIIAPQQAGGNAPLTVEQGIQAIRSVLRNPHGIVRLIGLPGTGKTRLVQALFDSKIGNDALDHSIVTYVDQGSDQPPTPSARDMIHRCAVNGLRTIVVVDNCNPALHRDLAQAVSTSDGFVSLITVEYDVSDDEPEETQVFRLEPASEKNIEEILQRLKPNVSQIDHTRIAEFSGGNARIALALARTVEHSGSLATLNDMELFRRLFEQRQGDSEALMKAAEVCSLVYSFDGETIEDVTAELPILASLAGIPPNELYRHIGELRSRDLVQRRSKWRAVLPHAIANRLARQALEKIHPSTLTNTFFQSGRERLLKSFSRRLGYLHDSEQAKQMAEDWLGSAGQLGNPTCLNELDIDMFMNVAPLTPGTALLAIESAASEDAGKTFLSPVNHERWRWYSLLRSIAYEPQYFNRAALLLARFVAEETESQNHNSTHDSFKELFHLYLSGTHALVEVRLTVVQQLLESEDKRLNACGLTALAAMLENFHFTSSHDFSFGGGHRDFGWIPTDAEISAWFRVVVAFAINQANSNSLYTSDIKQLLAQHFGELWAYARICNELEKIAKDFATQDGWPDGWLAIRKTIHFDLQKMSPEFAKRTLDLEIMLRPVKLEQKIRAYVLNKQGYFDITDIELDGDSDTAHMQAWERVNKVVEDLGKETAATPDILASLLPELLSSDNNMIWQFGRGLAKGALNIEQDWRQFLNILTTLPESKRNISLLRGFIEAASTRDSNVVNQLMDEALKDPVLSPVFPILQSSYPIDEAGARRLISSIARGHAPSQTYSYLKYGNACDSISPPLFQKILSGVASLLEGYSVAVDIFCMRLHSLQSSKTPINSDTSAIGRKLLKMNDFQDNNANNAYHVNEIAVACMFGDAAYQDAIAICTKLARALIDYRSGARQFGKLARTLFQLQPMAAIAVFLNEDWVGKTNNQQHRPLSYFFRFDRESPVNAALPEILMAWAKENLEVHLPKLAAEIHFFVKNGEHDILLWSPLALEILELAPDRSAILDIYASRLHPSGVRSGSLADNLSPYLALVEKLQTHDDSLVIAWAKRQTDLLTKEIAEEHKRDRRVDESFE